MALYFSTKCSPPSPGRKVTTWQFSSSPNTMAAELTISSENLPCVATIMWVIQTSFNLIKKSSINVSARLIELRKRLRDELSVFLSNMSSNGECENYDDDQVV